MKAIFVLASLLMGCATVSRSTESATKTSDSFMNVPLECSESLLKTWGEPSWRDTKEIAKRNYVVWNYERAPGKELAEFALDPSSRLIVEKIYLPETGSKEADLSSLLKSRFFASIAFQKISVRCAHFGETIYAAEKEGVLLISNNKERATVSAIAFMTPEVFQLELKENQERQCRWD